MKNLPYYREPYEVERNRRYLNGAEKDTYSDYQKLVSYVAWSCAPPGLREKEWEEYCDIRDGYALGTNTNIRQSRKKNKNEQRH